jgi:PKHD-type hydroxylase
MNQWWQMWAAYFSPEECEKIIELGLALPVSDATIGHGGRSNVDTGMRRSQVRWFNRSAEDYQWVFRRLENCFQHANVNAFNFELTYFREVQFTEYDASYEGKYDWHEDGTWCRNHPTRRKLSVCVQLSGSADYEGGNLEIDSKQVGGESNLPKEAVLRSLGTTLVFPSFLRHRVTPVTSGKRYSLVSWYEGPPFR